MLALVRAGISWGDALEMSPIETDRVLAIASSWAIPAERRVGGTVDATEADLDRLYG